MTPKETPAREFWLELGNECDDIVWHKPVSERAIHVIEKRAYDALAKELEKANAALDSISSYAKDVKHLTDLREERDALAKALAEAKAQLDPGLFAEEMRQQEVELLKRTLRQIRTLTDLDQIADLIDGVLG